jgi:hypothetical protein
VTAKPCLKWSATNQMGLAKSCCFLHCPSVTFNGPLDTRINARMWQQLATVIGGHLGS